MGTASDQASRVDQPDQAVLSLTGCLRPVLLTARPRGPALTEAVVISLCNKEGRGVGPSECGGPGSSLVSCPVGGRRYGLCSGHSVDAGMGCR